MLALHLQPSVQGGLFPEGARSYQKSNYDAR
jgi:hypothetical protein